MLSDIVCRISFDDNHNSVVLNCAKAILSALSYDTNKILFDMLEVEFYLSRDILLILGSSYDL